MLSKFKNEIMHNKGKEDRTSLAFTWFAKSASMKVRAVGEYLLDVIERGIKLICFCHHKTMMDGVEEFLNQKRVNHIRIDGQTPPKVRQEACDVFQSKDTFNVALLSLTACATGLNLTAATMVIFAETYWNPGVLAQVSTHFELRCLLYSVPFMYLGRRQGASHWSTRECPSNLPCCTWNNRRNDMAFDK